MFQISCVLLLIVSMTLIVRLMLKHLSGDRLTVGLMVVLGIYTLGNLYCTIFSRVIGSGVTVELRPFIALVNLFKESADGFGNAEGFFSWFMRGSWPITILILNILLYYPLGYLLPILFPKLRPKHVVLIGCFCSIFTEATQYLLKLGWCETDDVIHNTLGTAIGVWVWCLQLRKQERNEA